MPRPGVPPFPCACLASGRWSSVSTDARSAGHVAWAAWFAERVRSDSRFALLAPPSLSLVCFGLETGDEATAALLEQVNRRGRVCLSSATVGGRLALRLAVGGTLTRREDVEAAWAEVTAAANAATHDG